MRDLLFRLQKEWPVVIYRMRYSFVSNAICQPLMPLKSYDVNNNNGVKSERLLMDSVFLW